MKHSVGNLHVLSHLKKASVKYYLHFIHVNLEGREINFSHELQSLE